MGRQKGWWFVMGCDNPQTPQINRQKKYSNIPRKSVEDDAWLLTCRKLTKLWWAVVIHYKPSPVWWAVIDQVYWMWGCQALCLQDSGASTSKENLLNMCSKQCFISVTLLFYCGTDTQGSQECIQNFSFACRQFDMVRDQMIVCA